MLGQFVNVPYEILVTLISDNLVSLRYFFVENALHFLFMIGAVATDLVEETLMSFYNSSSAVAPFSLLKTGTSYHHRRDRCAHLSTPDIRNCRS